MPAGKRSCGKANYWIGIKPVASSEARSISGTPRVKCGFVQKPASTKVEMICDPDLFWEYEGLQTSGQFETTPDWYPSTEPWSKASGPSGIG